MARARSARAHETVLRAAQELVAERGIEATSVEAIARKSGVSKATIYKHWPAKEALLLEMLAGVFGLQQRPAFDSGNIKADIAAVLAYQPSKNFELQERIRPHLMAYSVTHAAFGQAWRNMVMEPPRRELRRLLKEGVKKGELSPDVDPDLSLILLLGPMMYWYIFLRPAPQDPTLLAEKVVDAFWRAFGTQKARLA